MFKAKVLKGAQNGRKIGFPTVNLDPNLLPKNFKEGIYFASVIYKDKIYKGAMYYGPRLVMNETKPILEIHIIAFNKIIYGEVVEFNINKFIRKIRNFKSMLDLKKQIQIDISKILKA